MWAILKMQARAFFKNPSFIFAFAMPLIMITVLGSIATNMAGSEQAAETVMLVLMGNVIVISIMAVITNSFGAGFIELKESAIIKRLGATEVSKSEALGGFMLWNIVLSLFQVAYVIFLTFLVTDATHWLSGDLNWGGIDWLGFFYGLIMLIVVSYTMTFMFISVSKTAEMYSLLAFTYFFFALYFGGLIFPGNDIVWMNVVSLFLPHTYVAHFFAGAMNDGVYNNINIVGNPSIWDSTNWSDEYVLHGVSSLNIYLPWVFAGLTGAIAIRNFKWD